MYGYIHGFLTNGVRSPSCLDLKHIQTTYIDINIGHRFDIEFYKGARGNFEQI